MLKVSLNTALCLLVEDQITTRDFIENSLKESFPGITIVAMKNIRETQAWMNQRSLTPDKQPLTLALIDLGLPDGSGIELVQQLTKKEPGSINVVITIHGDDAHLFDALAAGAYGYILKDEDQKLFIDILKRIENNEPPLSPAIAHRLLSHFKNPGIISNDNSELTSRERETLTLIARGLTVTEAANRMGLSSQTVAGYVKIVYQKLHVSNRADATREAIRRGLA